MLHYAVLARDRFNAFHSRITESHSTIFEDVAVKVFDRVRKRCFKLGRIKSFLLSRLVAM